MIKYECDKCGKILSKKEIKTIANFPVQERIIIRGAKKNAIVDYMDGIDEKEIHLCVDCYLKLSYFLKPYESEEEK